MFVILLLISRSTKPFSHAFGFYEVQSNTANFCLVASGYQIQRKMGSA